MDGGALTRKEKRRDRSQIIETSRINKLTINMVNKKRNKIKKGKNIVLVGRGRINKKNN